MRRSDDHPEPRSPNEPRGRDRGGADARSVRDDPHPRAQRRPGLSDHEVDRIGAGYRQLINAKEAASLLRVSVSTIHHRLARGMYRRAVIRGRPLLFRRDALIREHHRSG